MMEAKFNLGGFDIKLFIKKSLLHFKSQVELKVKHLNFP